MKEQTYIAIMIITICLYSCNSAPKRHEVNFDKKLSKDSVIAKADSLSQSKNSVVNKNECVRGEANPILNKTVFPNSQFKLQSDGITAYESVALENGDSLIIHNWGCEYFILTFSFKTMKFQADTLDIHYWLNSANKLMNGIVSGIKSPEMINEGLKYLEKYLKDRNEIKNIELGKEIVFDNNEIRSFVTLDRIEKNSNNKFTVTISFTTGPL
jgi:hypothetical protein